MFFRFLIGSLVSGLLILLGYYFMGVFLHENKLTEEQLEALKINPKTSEYQIYAPPRLPTVHSLSNDCENLAKNLLNTIDKNNYCQIDSDCRILPFTGYPLAYVHLVNVEKFKETTKAIKTYIIQRESWQCQIPLYSPMLDSSNFTTSCHKHHCIQIETRPKLPRLSTFEDKANQL